MGRSHRMRHVRSLRLPERHVKTTSTHTKRDGPSPRHRSKRVARLNENPIIPYKTPQSIKIPDLIPGECHTLPDSERFRLISCKQKRPARANSPAVNLRGESWSRSTEQAYTADHHHVKGRFSPALTTHKLLIMEGIWLRFERTFLLTNSYR
jgi:hypothetical protein